MDGRRYPLETVQTIARKHGFGSADVQPMPRLGIVNDVWALGDEAVLRIPRDAEAEADALTESVAVPVLRSHGVLTPELLVFDMDRDVVPYAYTVYRRAAGETLGTLPPGPEWERCYEQLGEQQRLVASIEVVPDPSGWLDQAEAVNLELELADARPHWPQEEEARWRQWMALFDVVKLTFDPAFLHWDLHPWNILVDPTTRNLTAVLDWGDAGFHDPAVDFAHANFSTVASQVRGFGGMPSPEFAARIVRFALIWMLCEVPDLDDKFRRDWWCYPAGGILEAAETARANPDLAPWVPDLR